MWASFHLPIRTMKSQGLNITPCGTSLAMSHDVDGLSIIPVFCFCCTTNILANSNICLQLYGCHLSLTASYEELYQLLLPAHISNIHIYSAICDQSRLSKDNSIAFTIHELSLQTHAGTVWINKKTNTNALKEWLLFQALDCKSGQQSMLYFGPGVGSMKMLNECNLLPCLVYICCF